VLIIQVKLSIKPVSKSKINCFVFIKENTMNDAVESKNMKGAAVPDYTAGTINKNEVKADRLLSLDALRGFDMFWIVCGEDIFHGIASVIKQKYGLQQSTVDWQITVTENLRPIEKLFVFISNQLHHSVWNGFTFYDLIFPLFIFIAGVSMPYSFGKYLNETDAQKRAALRKKLYGSLIKRTITLIFLGMVVNGLLQWNGYADTRFASVLGRIALSCFFAAIIYLNFSLRKQLLWFAGILIGYWALMMLIPVPGFGAGVLTPEGNFAAYVDRLFLPGKLHRVVYDPEGLLSTIPSIASALLGVFTGRFLKGQSIFGDNKKKTFVLFAGAVALLLAGLLWNELFPINKNMWTSSFVLYAGGWSVLLFAIFYSIVDVAGFQKWARPLIWMGRNSILIYMAAHGIVNFTSTSEFLFGGIIRVIPEVWQPVLLWTGVALIQFCLLYFLNKKKWYLKI
jgi:predicted acyltransferase